MTSEQADATAREAAERQAADWIVRLSDPALSPDRRAALRAELERWMAASPLHRELYGEIDRTWRLLRTAALEAGTLGHAEGEPQPQPPPPPRLADRRPAPGHRRAERLAWRLAAAVAVGLLLGLARFYGGDPLLALEADYRTAPGETRRFVLADGSSLVLGSGSAFELNFTAAERRLRLLKGEAAFEVAADPDRPFIVETGGLEAQALGTRFQLRRAEESVQVTVIEHLVRVRRAGEPLDAAVILGRGERLELPPDGTAGRLDTVDLARATAWQRGRLVFDRQPLAEVVAELNRHRRGRIVVADAGLAAREVSGVIHLDDLDSAVERIARELGAERIDLPPFLSLLY